MLLGLNRTSHHRDESRRGKRYFGINVRYTNQHGRPISSDLRDFREQASEDSSLRE